MTPERTIGRLILYRRILCDLIREDVQSLHSHQLALMAGVTAAQVRRDLMAIGAGGHPKRGYSSQNLADSLNTFLDAPEAQRAALVGIGNVGLALLSYFQSQKPRLHLAAAFDDDPSKTGREIQGCRCYPTEQLEKVLREEELKLCIIAVPAGAAQAIADRVSLVGVKGIVNFAPVALHLPASVFVENVDVIMSLEKASFFASKGS